MLRCVRSSLAIRGSVATLQPDLLATFIHAFGVDPRRYLRDGEIVPELYPPGARA